MYPISSDILALFQSGAMQYARLTIGTAGQTGYQLIENDRIKQGGFNVNRFAETDDTVKIGSCSAAELTVVLDNRDGVYDDYDFIGKEAKVEVGVDDDGTITYVPFGYFTFDEAGYDKSALRLAALDRMLFFERTIDASQLSFPYTITQLLTRICTVCGVPLGNIQTLLNGGISVPSLPKDAKTYRDLLVWIAEISGNVAYINYDGELMLGWYQGSQFSLTTANRKNSTLERGTVLVTGVEVVVGESTTLQGTSARTIRVENNPLIPSGQESFIATGLFNKVGGFSYTPFSATVLPMPHIEPLDGCTFVTEDNESVFVPITDWSFNLNGSCSLAGKSNQATYRRGYGLADAILQSTNLADKAVTTAKIADNAVDTAQLAALAVQEGKIAANAVTEGKIAANAVVADKIASNAVTTDKLNALAVTAGKIASGAVTTDKIDAYAVTADKISVTDLSALRATIAGWTIDANALKKTYGANGGVWLNAPTSPSGSNSAFHAQDIYGENNLYLNYDGSLESTFHLEGVEDDAVKVDDGEIVLERQYYKTPGDTSSEKRRGETQIFGSEIEVVNSKRDNTESRDEPLYEIDVSAFPTSADLSIEAHTSTADNHIWGIVDGSDAYVEVKDNGGKTKMDNAFRVCNSSGTEKSRLSETELIVNGVDMLKYIYGLTAANAAYIGASQNLNTSTYCNPKMYYCSANATVRSLSNCPTQVAFVMVVRNLVDPRQDPNAGTYQYIYREITDINGDRFYQSINSSATAGTYNYGAWIRQWRTIDSTGEVLLTTPTATNSNSYAYFDVESTHKAAVGWSSTLAGAFISSEAAGRYLGITDAGDPFFATSYSASARQVLARHGQNISIFNNNAGYVTNDINKSVSIHPDLDSWREGIRIYPHSNGWTTFLMGGQDLSAASGTSANTWSMHNHNGKFYITRNGSDSSSSAIMSCENNIWKLNGKEVVTGSLTAATRNTTNTTSASECTVYTRNVLAVTHSLKFVMTSSGAVNGATLFTGLPKPAALVRFVMSSPNLTGAVGKAIQCVVDTNGNLKNDSGQAVSEATYYGQVTYALA